MQIATTVFHISNLSTKLLLRFLIKMFIINVSSIDFFIPETSIKQ